MKEFIKLVWDFVIDYPGYSIVTLILFVVFILFTKAALEIKENDIFFWWRCH